MKLGNSKLILSVFFFLFYNWSSLAEDKILSSPLINLDELKPSFEEVEESKNNVINDEVIKNKKEILPKNNLPSAKFIGLDKITAKTSDLIINLGETKKFGTFEIKVLKCGKINSENGNNNDSVAYLQVKDLTENENEKVFIFNGWTFSSDPTIAPFDHAIYDLQLINCNNI